MGNLASGRARHREPANWAAQPSRRDTRLGRKPDVRLVPELPVLHRVAEGACGGAAEAVERVQVARKLLEQPRPIRRVVEYPGNAYATRLEEPCRVNIVGEARRNVWRRLHGTPAHAVADMRQSGQICQIRDDGAPLSAAVPRAVNHARHGKLACRAVRTVERPGNLRARLWIWHDRKRCKWPQPIRRTCRVHKPMVSGRKRRQRDLAGIVEGPGDVRRAIPPVEKRPGGIRHTTLRRYRRTFDGDMPRRAKDDIRATQRPASAKCRQNNPALQESLLWEHVFFTALLNNNLRPLDRDDLQLMRGIIVAY